MRLKALLAAAITAISSLTVVAAPTATAAPGNTVVYGDSLIANPELVDLAAQKGIGQFRHPRAQSGCASDHRFVRNYAKVTGRPTDNFTCSGSAYTHSRAISIRGLINQSIGRGKLNAQTREVVLLAGANDSYVYAIGPNAKPVGWIEANLRNAMVRTINHIKHHAPNARIKVVGYPRITDRFGNVCPLHLIPGHPTPSLLFRVGGLENVMQRAGQSAARTTGATFVDMKGISRGHEMCSPHSWISGLFDVSPEPRNMSFHMTNRGLDAMAVHAARS